MHHVYQGHSVCATSWPLKPRRTFCGMKERGLKPESLGVGPESVPNKAEGPQVVDRWGLGHKI